MVCSIDNMPTQLPKESTDFFGELVLPYVSDIIMSDATKPLEEHNFQPAVYNVRFILLYNFFVKFTWEYFIVF